MDIYNIDGTLFKSVSLAKDAVHEQELMKSNFIRLTWNDRASETIPVGSFIVYEGVRYMLLEDYTPKQNRHRSFTYTPEFQHPVIWLSKIPFWQEIAEPSDPTKTVRRYDWSYANYPQTISNYLASFIQGLGIEDLNDTEKEWTALVDERIQMTGVCAFSSVDVFSACSVIANTFDCQFNIDFEAKQIRFGNPDEHFSLRFDGTGYEAPVLKSGQNVGVASVTETKEEYHNAYLVQGSTRNLSKTSDSGDPVQVTERLTLLPDTNPDSIIYLNGDTEVTKEQFDALGVPMLFKSLIFDDIYPKYNLFLYNIRERRRWLIDSSTKEKISATQSDGWEFEGGYYKYYSEWYFRLAYYTNAPIAGKSTIHTESKEGKTYYWYDYDLTDEAHGKVTSNTRIPELSDSFVTDIPADSNIFTGDEKRMPPDKLPMQTVPYYEVTVKKGNTTAAMAAFGYNGYIVLTNDLTSSSLTFNVGDTFTFVGGVNTAYFDDEHRTSQIIKNKVLSISFQPNYDSRFSSPLTSRDFELVHFNTQTTEKSDDDINPNGFTAQKGDYRIVFTEDNGLRLPTTFKGGLYPKPKTIETDGDVSWAYPTLENNIGTLFNIVIDETWKTQAQLELKQRALSEIARLKKDLNKYSLPYNSVMYREAPLNLSVGQRVTYNNGQDLNGGSAYILQTQVIKLVTRLDKPEITTVTVGNEKTKGSIQTMKEQIETIIAGGVSSSSGGGMTERQFVNLLINHGDKRYIRRDINDETDTDLTANKFVAKEGVKTDTIGGKTGDTVGVENNLEVGDNAVVHGDTELNGNVTIGNSASDEALIKAIAKVFQQIKSNNYSGDSPFDMGWMIKNADANHGNASYMVIDNLFVRMKAIFTELEIRKISYAGGNIILSHAGSTLVKVVPLTTTMQPTVVNGRLTISGDLARVENNRLILDNGTVSGNKLILDGSQEVLYAYRCYIKKDDGTTATENWWRVDDQARCQTFNIDETGTYHDVSNSFYWRRVMNVGSEVPIGETTDEVMDYVDLSALDCITGSTVPKAGDMIVQMGNRTDVSRQGFISLEVYGDDAPAFKVYKYVNGYTLKNKRPIIISPKNTSMKVQHYEIETDYGTFPAVKERGEWSLIDEHKCYYYDRVQHNGSSWLCVYPSGLTPEYTTDEPSLSSVYWKVDAKAGEPAPSYTEDWFAWSNVASVVDVTTEPTPNSGWLQTIGAQGSDTYLWRKLIRYIWNPTTRVYVSDSTQYFRMSGTNGTSIDINGEVALHTDMEANGYVTPVGGTRHLADDGESYVLQEDWIDSEGVNRQGHLFMWSTESTRWIPLGKFQGDAGKTYYTHVAWATSVTYNQSTGEVTNVSGFVITKAPDDKTHFWMGVYVDENSAIDPSDALLYTWSYTKGDAGTSVFVDEENSSTEYAISTSGTQRPVSGWQSNPPVVPKGQFLWTRVTTVFTDTSQTVSYSVSYMGTDVQIDASRTFVRYSTAKTATQPADNTFTLVTPPSLSEGEYLWSLSQTAYVGVSDALKSYAVSRFGINGKVPQLILSPYLIAIPTDTDGVVLEDFRKEIAVSMKTYSDVLTLKSVDFIANENVVLEESTLIAMAWSGASIQNGRLVNVEGSVNNGRLTISADDYAVVPTKIVVKATKGTTLTERTVSIFATAWDEDGNEYNGYNELTVQRQYRAGKPQFPSMVFKRSVIKPATPIGGTYTNPIPEGWEDGIPSGTGIVWASVCTFYGDGTSSGWSEPQAQIDTDNLDLEFSASSTEPSAPTGDVPFADHESEGWYDPTSPNLPEMVIWRAERKVKNGAYDGDWVVTRIYGEKGDTGADAINVALSQFAVLFSQDVSSDDDTAAHAIAQITPETIASQVVVTKGETPITTGVVVSVSSTSHFNTSGVTIEGTTITLDKDGIQVYEKDGRYYPYDNGYVDLNVAYNGKNYPLRLQFYVNLMGKFKTTIEGDVETSIASKHTYYLNADGTALERDVEQQGTYIRSAEENIQRLDEQVNDPTTGLEHKYSEISQNVNKISLKVGQYYNLFYNAFFGELLAERSPYSPTTSISLVSEGTYGGKVIRMGGGNFNQTMTSSIMGSDTKGYGVYLDKGTYTFQMYAKVQTSYPSTGFAGIELLWDDNADFSTWSSSKIIHRIQVTETSYSRYTYTFTLASARYVGFRMILDGISIGSTSFNLYIDAVMLEIGSKASSMISSYGGYQSGADVGKVRNSLLATGIDIEKGKITMTADKFECQNNSGVKTAWLDDMGNFTIRGVYNNLITVINNSNWNKYIIKIGSGTLSKWYLDVLLCGTFVVIESIPSDVVDEFNSSNDGMLNLPYYANDNYFTRGYTRYLASSNSEPRLMTADELRMLAGRKFVIKWNAITGISNRAALGYVFRPEVYYGNTTITTDMLNYRLRDLYAGERHCISINPSDTSVNRSPVLYVPRTFFMSFNLVKFHTSQAESNYSWGYIWMADDDSGSASQDDINWT